jgi:hypothetical protein
LRALINAGNFAKKMEPFLFSPHGLFFNSLC